MTTLRAGPLPGRPSLTRDVWGFLRQYPAAAFITLCVVVVNLLYAPFRFADYGQYLVLTDGLYYFAQGKWLDFEVGSNVLFLGLRLLTGNTVRAVNLAHYILGAAYIYFTFRLAHRDEVNWRGLMVTFALYGSLLAFVTIRATPAYMLVALGALEITRGRNRGLVLTLAASLFHVSALLALGPMILGWAQNRFAWLRWIGESTRAFVAVIASVVAFFGLARELFASAVTSLVSMVPFLNKYDVYTTSLDPLNNTGQDGGLSTNHLAYAIVMSLFTLVFIAMPDARCRKLRLYVVSSYFLFLILEFAPVTAYRQSQFWVIPAMLAFPWARFAPAGFRAVLFAGACVALFLLAVRGVVA